MKVRVTKKSVLASFDNCISTSYCAAQHLLACKSPFAYTASNMYGWGADIYDCGITAIVTGYRPFGKHVDYEIVKRYDAQAIDATEEEREKLIQAFIEEVLAG